MVLVKFSPLKLSPCTTFANRSSCTSLLQYVSGILIALWVGNHHWLKEQGNERACTPLSRFFKGVMLQLSSGFQLQFDCAFWFDLCCTMTCSWDSVYPGDMGKMTYYVEVVCTSITEVNILPFRYDIWWFTTRV